MNKTGWLFPGQASQKVGMGLDLYQNSNLAKKYFEISKEMVAVKPKVRGVCMIGFFICVLFVPWCPPHATDRAAAAKRAKNERTMKTSCM